MESDATEEPNARKASDPLDSELRGYALGSEIVSEVIRGIPGVLERIRIAREQLARGEGIPLDEI
jgi:hypothetical protein